ncbi:hypothetical protein QUF72_14030 [Desulfobacterales bacterium HSG2]|nr:hypothetical protein [Desulfobacterales bacterium HSG2]
MKKDNVLDKNGSYTFSDYFKMKVSIEDIADFFGYKIDREELVFKKTEFVKSDEMDVFKNDIKQLYKFIDFSNEASRREFLIAPVLFQLVKFSNKPIRIHLEEDISVNDLLKGTLDYYIESENKIVIVEAKNVDLVNGMKQLAVELIAMDHFEDRKTNPFLYGAVSIGEDWRFARLDREKKRITEDIKLYRVPEETEILLSVLMNLLD